MWASDVRSTSRPTLATHTSNFAVIRSKCSPEIDSLFSSRAFIGRTPASAVCTRRSDVVRPAGDRSSHRVLLVAVHPDDLAGGWYVPSQEDVVSYLRGVSVPDARQPLRGEKPDLWDDRRDGVRRRAARH